MKQISLVEVDKIAALAKVSLTPEERSAMVAELGSILAYIGRLGEAVTTDVEPFVFDSTPLADTRSDRAQSFSAQEPLLFPERMREGLLATKKVFNERKKGNARSEHS
ncbi:MAG: hypothetical protein A3B30_03925 [Candidatus Komeilibacteria bacterium RIFCSPLOWO2_01_FULL_52_15]|uniref:Aspartyl/glutamyl-tRNA(Asn/Gln) amidotransferase subunit C n=1 Tax=Candidatus Komeilibacteria bacterium RIFCSPLOWO2_01_FULL_52_15 TaxID=1798551 RepID=A0A1G2BQB0_9BACT|nr:MAG: hypothetical protein A3B30_03925 [Candidatus Komeilibacteria bacterium RIFCSPLOWO2_01_FULL_52_15]